MTCDAYPDGIPSRFRFGDDAHVEPAEGDHGIQFEMREHITDAERRVALLILERYRQRKEAVPPQAGQG
jgi:hypothetical protein